MKNTIFMAITAAALSAAPMAVNGAPDAHAGPWIEAPISRVHELVMPEGTRLVAETDLGPLSIVSGPGYERTYTWDQNGCSRSVVQWPRSERWYGAYGIYFPGPGDHWAACNGIARGVLEEAQMHFASAANALAWIEYRQSFCRPESGYTCSMRYTNDGLVVVFGKVMARRQLDVGVYQIYINGVKPGNLTGATGGVHLEPLIP